MRERARNVAGDSLPLEKRSPATVGQTEIAGLQDNEGIMTQHELHPLCTLFPRLSGADFDALAADIKANGLREPITTHDGMILDGGNRYRACLAAGVKPTFAKFKGESLVAFVLSVNLHRRHMTPGQQAAIVASAQDWAKSDKHGGDRKSDQGATLHLDSVGKRAAESGASVRTQKMADKVAKTSPELAGKVSRGEISLPKAAKQLAPSNPVETPEAKVVKIKTSGPTVESLLADNEALRGEIATLKDNARELAALLESYDSATAGEHETARAIAKVKGQLRTVEATRDQWMTTAGELRREVKALQRKLKVAA